MTSIERLDDAKASARVYKRRAIALLTSDSALDLEKAKVLALLAIESRLDEANVLTSMKGE